MNDDERKEAWEKSRQAESIRWNTKIMRWLKGESIKDYAGDEYGKKGEFRVAAWNAGGNFGYVLIKLDCCVVCGVFGPTLYSDGSDGEYGGTSICEVCIRNAFSSFANQGETEGKVK
jgi:hypothetical protein